jgi:phosphatidylglycerophosphate synthase
MESVNKKPTLKEVKARCSEGRFFKYDDWRDKFFVPPSIYLVWACVFFGISGAVVSWISVIFAVIGAIFLSSADKFFVLIGSFGYFFYYLLDYVDGSVARYNKKANVSGQYLDWIMHVIASIATLSGIFVGAIKQTGDWIFFIGILSIISASLFYSKYSMAWFSICMERQQQQHKKNFKRLEFNFRKKSEIHALLKPFRYFCIFLFHENYLFFTLPIMAAAAFVIPNNFPDFRIAMTVISGLIYLPIQIIEIINLSNNQLIEKCYNNLFDSKHQPNLPSEHFFK